ERFESLSLRQQETDRANVTVVGACGDKARAASIKKRRRLARTDEVEHEIRPTARDAIDHGTLRFEYAHRASLLRHRTCPPNARLQRRRLLSLTEGASDDRNVAAHGLFVERLRN